MYFCTYFRYDDDEDGKPSAKRQRLNKKKQKISEFDSGFDGALLTGRVGKQNKKKKARPKKNLN